MAKIYEQFSYSLVKKLVSIFMKVAIGASGAPTLSASDSKGVASIVRNSAGNYTVTFSELYYAFVMASFLQLKSSAEDVTFQVLAVSMSAKTVQFLCKDGAGAAVDPSSGSTLYAEFKFKESSV